MNRDLLHLFHIRDAIHTLLDYKKKGQKEFFSNRMLQDAVIRNIEILGEATGHISDSLKKENPGIPWRKMKDTRNFLIHEYFRIRLDRTWNILTNELPDLKKRITSIIKDIEE